ncbi:hypothetical protein PVAP13_5NG170200 [Panicum virgatum]|uniref:Uncharacterized protein n=1 Tax=Panicum virgatum TaxID=38727 RepID=A0A8T0RPC0_PANVG|nr:hypothetical protein PVAP13_5NG170200 [Panicum virgatum]
MCCWPWRLNAPPRSPLRSESGFPGGSGLMLKVDMDDGGPALRLFPQHLPGGPLLRCSACLSNLCRYVRAWSYRLCYPLYCREDTLNFVTPLLLSNV